ncbi:MAG: 6-phosphogluconolactonase [Planctomycetia bacterium]|nr:6-phosphogluconolactonase [Planctomycetia bacterium]
MIGTLHVYENEAAVFHAAAEKFVSLANSAIAAGGRFTVALSGGSTPKGLYELLTLDPYRGQVAWDKVEWFFGDERSVGPDDPESNYRMAREAFLLKLAVPPERTHRIAGESEQPSAAAAQYAGELAQTFGLATDGPPPTIDLVLLGMGSDGHTASLFPFTAALNERAKWVVANDVPQLHTRRYTLTVPVLNAAACVLFMITGVGKAKVLQEVLEGPREPERLPSQLIAPGDGRLLWYVDRAAASRLES